MRLKAGLLAPAGDLRRTVDGLFRQMEQDALRRGFTEAQTQSAKFALAALVDETVLSGGSSVRGEWERQPLQLEYFKEVHAGLKFFERLDILLKNAEQEADVIEVYYLCLLLGFKGKYHIFLEDQLPGVINNVETRLRQAGRLTKNALAPHWLAKDQPDPPRAAPVTPRWVKLAGGSALGAVVLVYLLLNFLLAGYLTDTKQLLLK